jgi:formiminotetrahydrofolate cyclodeaminase
MDSSTDRLVSLSVGEFVAKVASTEEPVPAGGSVAALTGACAAALLALASGVLVRRGVGDAERLVGTANALLAELLRLVDEDAAAYDAFLADKRDRAAIARMNEMPLRVASTCRDVSAMVDEVAERITGAIAADVNAARTLADAACQASLDLAEANIRMERDPAAQAQLKERIQELRGT